MASKKTVISGTDLIHSDSHLASRDVTAAISVSTTFRSPHPDTNPVFDESFDWRRPEHLIYSRYSQNVSTRAEHVLSKINQGYALTYASGLAASFAAVTHYQPKRIAITGGYHGCHAAIDVYKRGRSDFAVIDIDDELQEDDLLWLETPLNPTGESRDIKYYADKIHAVGGHLLVDSTFGPPPLQYPFKWGADLVMHSGTKYFGGHSDLLCGVLVTKTKPQWDQLWNDRTFTGNVMGSLEAWLLLRSLRTLHLRVARQSESASILAKWLAKIAATPIGQSFEGIPGGVITKVWHSSLQGVDSRGFDPVLQMEGGWNATFSFFMGNGQQALKLPHSLKYFVPATSLGGVESLMEHRFSVDSGADPRLIRISIGVEDVEDLKNDLKAGLRSVSKISAKL